MPSFVALSFVALKCPETSAPAAIPTSLQPASAIGRMNSPLMCFLPKPVDTSPRRLASWEELEELLPALARQLKRVFKFDEQGEKDGREECDSRVLQKIVDNLAS